MAVELLDSPQVHAIITANNDILFHLPELAKVILNKPVPSVLKAIGYAKENNKPLSELHAYLITNKASGMHDLMHSKGLLATEKDFSSKLIPSDQLGLLLKHYDQENGINTATAAINAAMRKLQAVKTVNTDDVCAQKKARVAKSNEVPTLSKPPPCVIKQRNEMQSWATGDVSIRGNFKGVSLKTFHLYYQQGISTYLQYLHTEHNVPKDQLKLSIAGTATVFDKEKIEGYDEYCKNIRGKNSFFARANSFKGVICAAKYLIRNQKTDSFRPTPEQSFIKALSSKCTELQSRAASEPKPVKTKVIFDIGFI